VQSKEDSSCLYWLIPYESVELCLDALYTIQIVENLQKQPTPKETYKQPAGDQTQDVLFETNKTNTAQQKVSSQPSQHLDTSQISAEMTDLSHRSHASVHTKVPSPLTVKLQKQHVEEIVSDLDIDVDLKSEEEYEAAYQKPKIGGGPDSDDEYDPYGLPHSARDSGKHIKNVT
jgi:hypothetical protein